MKNKLIGHRQRTFNKLEHDLACGSVFRGHQKAEKSQFQKSDFRRKVFKLKKFVYTRWVILEQKQVHWTQTKNNQQKRT